MKKIGLYPGTFNPWHQGHEDILRKASKIFDKVIVATLRNPEKEPNPETVRLMKDLIEGYQELGEFGIELEYVDYAGLMVDLVEEKGAQAIIRGLRNGNDLTYEANLQYWNEDLGLKVPMVCFITDRALCHISSSAIRALGTAKDRLHASL